MAAVADDPPPPVGHLEAYRAEGRLWVAVLPPGDEPVGYAQASLVDGAAHLDQLSVHPAHQRRGMGRRLVDHVDTWAADRGLPAMTLSTFTEVPWNGPWYQRLGFTVVPDAEWGPGLRRVRERERRAGLDVDRRQLMRRPVGARR